jgi:hypothetical protein
MKQFKLSPVLLTQEVHAALKAEASACSRTLQQQVRHLLTEHYDPARREGIAALLKRNAPKKTRP